VGVAIAGEDRATRLHGAFVNPNNLAGYLEIGLAFAFGFLWYRTRTGLNELAEATGAEERSERLLGLLPRTALGVVVFGVLAGIVVSQSRGGRRRVRGTLLPVALLAAALRSAPAAPLLATLVAPWRSAPLRHRGAGASRSRFLMPDAADLGADYRILIWRDSPTRSGFPWLGSASARWEAPAGSSRRGGLVDRRTTVPPLVTGGVAGALLGLAALVFGVRALLAALSRQKHREESAFGLAGFGALAMLLLHGVAEFNFSIPAVPATLAACLGGAWAALQWARSDESAPTSG
jgi:hypothetical protein